MKTLTEIKLLISDLRDEATRLDPKADKTRLKQIKKSLPFLTKVETYLMSEPNAEYLKIELDKVKRKIKDESAKGPIGFDGFLIPRYKPDAESKKRIDQFDRQNGINKLKDFKKFLTFINS